MKIVILDAFASNPGDLSWEEFSRFGELTLYPRTAPEEAAERIGNAEVVFLNKTPISAQILSQCPKLRMIGILATGYNIVDIAAAKARGIMVCNVPGYSTMAVAQMTFALLLELTQHAGLHAQAVKNGQWQRSPDFCFWNAPLTELAGKSFGVVGYGAIGQAVGRIARAFGMELLVTSRREMALPEGGTYLPLPELLSRADVVSLHCPQTAETTRMIGAEALGRMKPTAVLLNTARGGLVDEAALAKALLEGRLAGYGADVVSREPILAENPLLQAPNCVLTPHIAWAPKETRQRLHRIALDNLRCFLAGQPQNVVNP